jgi:hypothetical protein
MATNDRYIAGDFDGLPGDELLVIRPDGEAHIMKNIRRISRKIKASRGLQDGLTGETSG